MTMRYDGAMVTKEWFFAGLIMGLYWRVIDHAQTRRNGWSKMAR
jgi:hypothetical protein|nr:MAG TPA: hypothetical protein [Herelleviridae sp.]